jgi:two-component system chemotaxis response regulator CheY
MFTKLEVQVIAKTLLQRREWLTKNLNNPELSATKPQNQQTLELMDSILGKLGIPTRPSQPETAPAANLTKSPKLRVVQTRDQLEPKDIHVLVVDDDELIGSLLESLLQSLGINHVDTTNDGLKAINMMYDAQTVYDLVLCDWNMPIKNGLDVHNAMRASERYIDTCFMLVTAVTEAKQIRAAIDEGVDDYVVKPIEEQKIIKKIQRYFPRVV